MSPDWIDADGAAVAKAVTTANAAQSVATPATTAAIIMGRADLAERHWRTSPSISRASSNTQSSRISHFRE